MLRSTSAYLMRGRVMNLVGLSLMQHIFKIIFVTWKRSLGKNRCTFQENLQKGSVLE
jgi:hypothetical protein